VSELVRDLKGLGWKLLLVAPLAYLLVRFALHLILDLLGKVGTTLAVLIALVVGGAAYVVGGLILGTLLRPILWLFDQLLKALEAAYPRVIRAALANWVVVYGLMAGMLAATVWALPLLDSELIPELHQGEFTAEVSLPVGTPLPITDSTMAPIERLLTRETPHLRTLVTTIGSERDSEESGERGEHTARLRVALTAQKKREVSKPVQYGEAAPGATATDAEEAPIVGKPQLGAEAPPTDPAASEREALAIVRPLVARIPDAIINVTRPALFSFTKPIEVEVRGYELGELAAATAAVREGLERVAGLRDVKASILPGSPEVQIVYNRDALARYNLDIRTVAELVRNKVQGFEATKYNRKDRKIPVRVRLKDIDTATVEALKDLVVNPGQTRPVPLSAVADLTLGRGPNEIRRIGQQRVGLVTANLEGAGLGSAGSDIQAVLGELDLPAGVTLAVTGQSAEWETSSRSLYLALGLSIFLVYVIMASQFESLVYPLIILVTIPLAAVGVVWTLLLLGLPVSVLVFLGAILLAGIVVNNAIVLVDYAGQLKQRGMLTEDALALAGQVRLRPILMTTLTTVLGLLPMALGLGDGAELRTPMAITVIAGLGFSTVLTLVVIPTIYAGVDRLFGGATPEPREQTLARELAAVDRGHDGRRGRRRLAARARTPRLNPVQLIGVRDGAVRGPRQQHRPPVAGPSGDDADGPAQLHRAGDRRSGEHPARADPEGLLAAVSCRWRCRTPTRRRRTSRTGSRGRSSRRCRPRRGSTS
jgi:HAE1 family hydrophobic/amphiphilic exporter-1